MKTAAVVLACMACITGLCALVTGDFPKKGEGARPLGLFIFCVGLVLLLRVT